MRPNRSGKSTRLTWHRLTMVLGVVGVLALPPQARAQTAQKYTVRMQAEAAGALLAQVDGVGRVTVDYSYRNNGRGPDLKETFTQDTLGTPTLYEGRGTATFGNPILESYGWQDGRGRWTSLVDRGDKPVEAGALYVPIEGSPLFYAQLVRALLLRTGQTAPSVDAGKLSLERLAELELASSTGPVPVALYALIGVDTTPWYFWLRDSGDRAFFAQVSPWMEVIAEGHEAQAALLLARQLQAQTERLQALQKRTGQASAGADGDPQRALVRCACRGDARPRRCVDLRWPHHGHRAGGLDASRADADHRWKRQNAVAGSVLTCTATWATRTACSSSPPASLRCVIRPPGTTSSRRCAAGSMPASCPDRASRPMGFIEGRSPYSERSGFVVDSLEAAKSAVDWYAERGFIQLKLYNSFKPEWVKPLTDYAHAKGMRVGGHVPAFMRAEEAVRDGYDELHHINQVMLNFLVKREDDTRTLLRFSLVGEQAQDLDLDARPRRTFCACCASAARWWT